MTGPVQVRIEFCDGCYDVVDTVFEDTESMKRFIDGVMARGRRLDSKAGSPITVMYYPPQSVVSVMVMPREVEDNPIGVEA